MTNVHLRANPVDLTTSVHDCVLAHARSPTTIETQPTVALSHFDARKPVMPPRSYHPLTSQFFLSPTNAHIVSSVFFYRCCLARCNLTCMVVSLFSRPLPCLVARQRTNCYNNGVCTRILEFSHTYGAAEMTTPFYDCPFKCAMINFRDLFTSRKCMEFPIRSVHLGLYRTGLLGDD